MVVNTLALVTLLMGAGLSLGQQALRETVQPPAKQEKTPAVKSKLEEMLAEALKNNPDIRVAAANAALAEAELNRTRLQVTQKVIALHAALASQNAEVNYRKSQYERMKRLEETKSIGSEVLQEAQQKLVLAKAKLAELEAQLPALLGKVARAPDKGSVSVADKYLLEILDKIELSGQVDPDRARRRLWLDLTGTLPPPLALGERVQGPLADKLRVALKKPISLKVSNEFVSEVVSHLQKQSGVTFKLMSDGLPEPRLNLELTNLSLVAILQFIEDSEPGYRFVIREYGILFAPQAKLPPGATTVQEFLRPQPADGPRGREAKPHNPPAENVEGVIQRVEEPTGLLTISIGSDAGLAKGHTLELFRLVHEPGQSKYLGTVRILDVKAKEAVAQAVGRLADKPQVGDRVASRIEGSSK
jgi:hypothetical protein